MGKNKPHKCDKCKRKYESAKGLAKHNRLKHSEIKCVFVCDYCSKEYGQACTLREHCRDVHKMSIDIKTANEKREEKETVPNDAVRSSSRKKLLKLKCKKCGQVCSGASNLRRHTKKSCKHNISKLAEGDNESASVTETKQQQQLPSARARRTAAPNHTVQQQMVSPGAGQQIVSMQQQVHLQHQQAAQNQHQSQQVHQQLEDVEPIANLQPKKMISAAAKKYYCDENLIQVEQPLIVSQVKDPLPPPSAPSEATEPAASNRREKRVKVKANQNLANTERMSQHEVVVAVQRLTRRTRHTANGNTTRGKDRLIESPAALFSQPTRSNRRKRKIPTDDSTSDVIPAQKLSTDQMTFSTLVPQEPIDLKTHVNTSPIQETTSPMETTYDKQKKVRGGRAKQQNQQFNGSNSSHELKTTASDNNAFLPSADQSEKTDGNTAGIDEFEEPSVKLVTSKEKGSIFRSRAIEGEAGENNKQKRHVYKHKWDDDIPENEKESAHDVKSKAPRNEIEAEFDDDYDMNVTTSTAAPGNEAFGGGSSTVATLPEFIRAARPNAPVDDLHIRIVKKPQQMQGLDVPQIDQYNNHFAGAKVNGHHQVIHQQHDYLSTKMASTQNYAAQSPNFYGSKVESIMVAGLDINESSEIKSFALPLSTIGFTENSSNSDYESNKSDEADKFIIATMSPSLANAHERSNDYEIISQQTYEPIHTKRTDSQQKELTHDDDLKRSQTAITIDQSSENLAKKDVTDHMESIDKVSISSSTSMPKTNLIPNFRNLPKIPKLKNSITAKPDHNTILQSPIAIPKSFEPLKMEALESYLIPDELENDAAYFAELERMVVNSRENEDFFFKVATSMIYLEELSTLKSVQTFNEEKVKLKLLPSEKNLFEIKLKKEIMDINATDKLAITPSYFKFANGNPFEGQIISHAGKTLKVKIVDGFSKLMQTYHNRQEYNIFFQSNRLTYKLQHEALKWAKSHRLFGILINNPEYKISCEPKELKYDDKEHLNEEQNLAVANILQLNSSLPFCLFGPPGTGKTRTMAAAIYEIVRNTQKYALVCAQSNAACDEITLRLKEMLNDGEMIRVYAKTFNEKLLDERIAPISNFRENSFTLPSLRYLYQFRVIVCTLITAGCFARARGEAEFDSTHFDYVFIDEAASMQETMTFIPIAGVCSDPDKVNCQIVLAGDPHQLDAVVKSENATKLGYKRSFMEFLFNQKRFERDSKGNYNPNHIVQLKKNYRSHPAIIHVSNTLFYEGVLEAAAPSGVTDAFLKSDFLPNKSFPIIFDSISGSCKNIDHSFYNEDEVAATIKYVNLVLESKNVHASDIGIVSPYRGQCEMIKKACYRNGTIGISIGSAEAFQGQERPIIIVSTVRTNNDLGFVRDEKRLNVMITRPKSLLIILGDHTTLCNNPFWERLFEYCDQNGATLVNGRKMHKRVVL